MLAGGLLAACAPLPMRPAPVVSGRVVDAETGRPIENALVLVRHEGRYDRVLPDRRMLGEGETSTDAEGSFRLRPHLRPALTLWPWLVTETRVVAVAAPGYRCAPPRTAVSGERLELELVPAFDAEDERGSCPVEVLAARKGVEDPGAPDVLAARTTLGFGENCRGPVRDLQLAPDGRHAAFLEARGSRLLARVVALTPDGADATVPFDAPDSSGGQLAWTRSGQLGRIAADAAPGAPQLDVLWRPTTSSPPAAPEFAAPAETSAPAPDTADRNDEAALRWQDRHFELERRPEADGVREWLRIVEPDGRERRLSLPGESCAPDASAGGPQQRIAADGRSAVDLRWIEAGCRAVAIDLEAGRWQRLDGSRGTGLCRESRRVPAFLLHGAARAWALQVERRLVDEGLDPRGSFTLELGPGGEARVVARDLEGEPRSLAVPPLPIATPLRRIEVVAAGAASDAPAPAKRWQPL